MGENASASVVPRRSPHIFISQLAHAHAGQENAAHLSRVSVLLTKRKHVPGLCHSHCFALHEAAEQ